MTRFSAPQVECDFSTSPPANVIHHSNENRVDATGHEASSSFVITPIYNVNISDMISLIDSADSCRQYLKSECRYSSQSYWGWKNRYMNTVTNFWPGGDMKSGGCTCKRDNSCAGGRK